MRRVFLRPRELPALWVGVVRGDPVAMRRVLGARRGGRVGLLLALAGVGLAVPTGAMPWLVAAQLAIALPAGRLARPRLSWRQYQRLSLWVVGSALLLAALARALGAPATGMAVVAWLGAHLWLVHSLRRGLD